MHYAEYKKLAIRAYWRHQIWRNGGKVAVIAEVAGVTRQEVYRRIMQFELQPELYRARKFGGPVPDDLFNQWLTREREDERRMQTALQTGHWSGDRSRALEVRESRLSGRRESLRPDLARLHAEGKEEVILDTDPRDVV